MWPIELLVNWEKNPRDVDPLDLERLKLQIQLLGQYKPLIIKGDGTVLGGNMRLTAMRAMGTPKIWVSVVHPKNEKEELEYALSDNDRTGYYVENKMLKLFKDNPELNPEFYKGDFHPQMSFDVLLGLKPAEIPKDEDSKEYLQKQFDTYNKGLIKQIVLYFSDEEFQNTYPRLAKIADEIGSKNITTAVIYLLEKYERSRISKET